jgi:hypothetical protein
MKEEKYLHTGELQLQFLPYLEDEVVGHGDEISKAISTKTIHSFTKNKQSGINRSEYAPTVFLLPKRAS